MTQTAPFRTPPRNCVRPGSWLLTWAGDERPLPDELPGWDYATDLPLRRTVVLETDAVREATGLSDDAPLGVTAIWWPEASKLRRASAPEPVATAGRAEIELRLTLRGADLGGRLVLQTALVLLEEDSTPRPWIAHRAGSELWSDSVSVRLQGQGAMFPMAVVNLADYGHPANAPWVFEPPVELNAAAMGSMYLLINDANTAVCDAARRAADPSPIDEAILSAIYHDVGRMMVAIALHNDEVVAGEEFEAESFGDVLQGLLSSLFPGEDFAQLRTRSEADPTRFSAELADRLRLMADLPCEKA
jgi:hypothetical protein